METPSSPPEPTFSRYKRLDVAAFSEDCRCNLANGEVVPIPTLPESFIVTKVAAPLVKL